MADGRAAAGEELEVEIISKGEAIRRVSAYLGYDATRMPDGILKEVLAEMQDETQANPDPPSPMEVTGGTAPALLQLANRMVLGCGPQPSAGGTPIAVPQEPEAELAYPDAPAMEALPNEDSATESESEPEIIELRPEDLVSQQILLARQPIPAVPLPSQTVPTRLSRSNLDTTTIDESDDDDAHNPKRRRLDTVTRPPPASISHTHPRTSSPVPRVSSSVQHSLTRVVAPGSHTTPPTVHTPLSSVSSSLINPPPTSNVDAVLVWATHLAAKAASSNMVANPRAGPSRRAGQTDKTNDQYGVLASVFRGPPFPPRHLHTKFATSRGTASASSKKH
ncbi:hypothetical protein FRC06_007694 [Ceratobasidium sp. 370]|nr:hypothetical protein FRC06_007694 [Ceratobasidium sp. 370]